MFAERRLDDLVVFEKLGIKDRMAPGYAIRFATLCEFGSGVGARGVEQPVVESSTLIRPVPTTARAAKRTAASAQR
jgi:hypothetical protein